MIPLPTVPVAGETREEIAAQAALGFEILAAAREPPITAKQLYKQVDAHMTDSVSRIKFLSEDLPKLLELDHKAGQLFCSTHTNFGFCSSLNSSIHEIELEHGLSHIMDGFVVEIDYESKNGSCVGQFVDCTCRLVGEELKHKPWNVSKSFRKCCEEKRYSYEMFLYKDKSFVKKACAVCIYSRELIKEFLFSHPDIINRLACLVRDIYNLEYVVIVMAVVAAFGIQLI